MQALQLQELSLGYTAVSDGGLRALAGLTQVWQKPCPAFCPAVPLTVAEGGLLAVLREWMRYGMVAGSPLAHRPLPSATLHPPTNP